MATCGSLSTSSWHSKQLKPLGKDEGTERKRRKVDSGALRVGQEGPMTRGTRMYVLGGACNMQLCTSGVESCVPGEMWRTETAMSRQRAGCAAITLEGRIWVIGGHDSRSCFSLWSYAVVLLF